MSTQRVVFYFESRCLRSGSVIATYAELRFAFHGYTEQTSTLDDRVLVSYTI